MSMPLHLVWLAFSLGRARIRRRRDRVVAVAARISAEAAITCMLRRLLRWRTIVFLTGGDARGSEFLVQSREWVRRAVVAGADVVVAHARILLDDVAAAGYSGRLVRIPTIARGEQEDGCSWVPPPGGATLFWVGRAHPDKNLPMLERLMAGELADLAPAIVITDADQPVRNAVVHVGCPSPRSHFGRDSVHVLTSLFEGQSNVVAEAALGGTPTVALCTGGTPEVIEELDAGACRPPEEGDQGFARAVREVSDRFQDPQARAGLRARAHQRFVVDAPTAWITEVAALT
jgi:hypothetical protein